MSDTVTTEDVTRALDSIRSNGGARFLKESSNGPDVPAIIVDDPDGRTAWKILNHITQGGAFPGISAGDYIHIDGSAIGSNKTAFPLNRNAAQGGKAYSVGEINQALERAASNIPELTALMNHQATEQQYRPVPRDGILPPRAPKLPSNQKDKMISL